MPQGGEWGNLATVTTDGTGRVGYQDPSVIPGRSYGYRLMSVDASPHVVSPETWVEVPAAFRFALAGARPNPAPRSGMAVSFSLAQDFPRRSRCSTSQAVA